MKIELKFGYIFIFGLEINFLGAKPVLFFFSLSLLESYLCTVWVAGCRFENAPIFRM
jgi:hypothetical protein